MIQSNSHNPYRELIDGLRRVGYRDERLQEGYAFIDWFHTDREIMRVQAAAFAQTPASYDTACLGIVQSNGLQGAQLIDRCRSLGAPFVLEFHADSIREWHVSPDEGQHDLVSNRSVDRIDQLLNERSTDWKPEKLLRAKNIGEFHWARQLSLFSGLIPELENKIQESLDPLLRDTLSATRREYKVVSRRNPDPEQLFKLIFWLLTAKVFADRRVSEFKSLSMASHADKAIEHVARHYGEPTPRLLNRHAREVAFRHIWTEMDFRNLSVEVLAQIWSVTLVDKRTRQQLSIHRTSRSLVKYIIDQITFEHCGDEELLIVEPCCGSAGFLVGAMNKLRSILYGQTPKQRHEYFVRRIAGIEIDPFGVEISRLSLTLADFPNPNGWKVIPGDVFDNNDSSLEDLLRRAGVVLCNPPFGDFTSSQRKKYQLDSVHRPVELLLRILKWMHADAVLGIVLPRAFVSGRGYSQVRKELARRFSSISVTVLPDRAFPEGDSEIALVVATEPIPHERCRVRFSKVRDAASDWKRFEHRHEVGVTHEALFDPETASQSLLIPELQDLWDFLKPLPVLSDIAAVHRGIEWVKPLGGTGLVRESPAPGFVEGIAPRTKFCQFETPATKYLNLKVDVRRGNAADLPWDKPKVIVNKTTRSRGRWRLSAFADKNGLVCYQTFTAIWPSVANYDPVVLAAIINGPVANAYLATRSGKTDLLVSDFRAIPIPVLTAEQRRHLKKAAERYSRIISRKGIDAAQAQTALLRIDAIVLDAYCLPARLEHDLLEWFRGERRSTPFPFSEYYSSDDVWFSLSDRVSPSFDDATGRSLLARMGLAG